MTDLGTLVGSWSQACGVNNACQIVGAAWFPVVEEHAFLWENSLLYDLTDLILPGSGWELKHAEAINDAGQIVGWGWNPDRHMRAFLLTPIPEPSTLSLLALAFVVGMGWWRRR